MIEAHGLASFNPSVTLKEIAKQIADRDNNVRNAALNTVTCAFQICGEQVYNFIGKINEKELSMLNERIKRSGKSAPVLLPVSTAQRPAKSQTQVKRSASGGTLNNVRQKQQSGGMRPASSVSAIDTGSQKLRREFTLDLKDDDDDIYIRHVKLTAYEDIEELLSWPAVELPARRTVISRQANILKESSDVKESIDLVITHISHYDIETSIQILRQV
jgi:cytoskeleton-associated protein 5